MLGDWVESFFSMLARSALNPLLEMLGDSILVTPQLDENPQLVAMWENSRAMLLAVYVLVVTVAGIVAMSHHTVQTQHSVKEILPRVVVGFLAANMSLLLAGKAIALANALSRAVLGGGVAPGAVGRSLRETLTDDLDGGGFLLIFVALALAVMIVLVLLTYVVRLMLTVILLAGAPLFLLCHALPQTEAIAFWWWKAFAGVLVIQIGQSLALIAAVRLFFGPGGLAPFG